MIRTLIALAAALVTAAGCGAGTDAQAAPTPTQPERATVGQYASIVAEHGLPIRDALDNVDTNLCMLEDTPACGALVLSLMYTVQTIDVAWQGQTTPGGDRYLGPPPDEIAGLVDETTRAIATAADAARTYEDCTAEDVAASCGEAKGSLIIAADLLDSTLRAWEPYL